VKIAVGSYGFVAPHIVKVDDVKWDDYAATDDAEPYSFTVHSTGPRSDKVYAATQKEAEEKRKKVIGDINRYYGESLDI